MKRLADDRARRDCDIHSFPSREGNGIPGTGRGVTRGSDPAVGSGRERGVSGGGAVNETAALHFIDSTLAHIHTTTARHQSPISLARLPPARRSADYSHPSIGLQSNAPSDALSAR